jgi:hypothetical protein
MNEFIALENIDLVLQRERLLPTVVMWNRLEGRPRREDFLRALRAEVRDPLWMLCKQWQVGEFRGDDAGSPVFAKVHIDTTRITRFRAGQGEARDFDNETPLEATVEQRPVNYFGQDHILSLDIRLALGRQWLKLLKAAGLVSLAALFVAQYGIDEPDPASRSDAFITAHPPVWQTVSALAGRAMDGAKLYFHLKADSSHRTYDGIGVADADKPALDQLAARFFAWYEGLFHQPQDGANNAWIGSQLEYQFALSAPIDAGEKRLVAEEYYQGQLDWYSLDIEPQAPSLSDGGAAQAQADPRASFTNSFFPVNLQFEGMPNTRWWTFEDSKTSFGDIKPDTTDINKLLLMEFGLIYANDWFIVPFQLPVGSLAKIAGLAVTNVFGERTWVRASGTGADEDWQRWAMYNLTVKGNSDVAADTTLVMLPTVPKRNDGDPLDDVGLIRDEVSNMVWAVEHRIPLATGLSARGSEAGIELAKRLEGILDGEINGGLVVPAILDAAAAIRYDLMQDVPENWIPFIPVHVDGSNREIQLQRASMPRIIIGDPNPPEKIKPRSGLMRQGLDQTPAQPYFLHEEEVPRAGVRVTQGFQRTRWHDGRVFVWLGVGKQTGRGEGHSGLSFDRVKSTKQQLRPALRRFVNQ